jgi:hypothetical protein
VDLTGQRTREWPVLRAAQELECDGRNPRTGDPCLLGYHRGPHRDEAGFEWLDDGDLAHPDWLNGKAPKHPRSPTTLLGPPDNGSENAATEMSGWM